MEGNAEKVADEFNGFFNSVTESLLRREGMDRHCNMVNEVGATAEHNNSITTSQEYSPTLDGFRLTIGDVKGAIKTLKNKRSVGADGISSCTIKELPKFFAKILTPLFNKSLAQGFFPDWLKMTIIVPAAKGGGDPTQMTNYRPIALLSCISKIFEKYVKDKILNYLDHINFLADQQFGFRKNKSTDSALFVHIANIVNGIEQNNVAVGVYLDLAKAFDTVNHSLMIRKLQTIGLRGPLLDWFTSYLSRGEHCVKIGKTYSLKLETKHGVPQGGP